MQPADSDGFAAHILVILYALHLDITYSWKDLARLNSVGNRISHMRPAESARYTAYILVYGKIYAVYLDITDSWKDLA